MRHETADLDGPVHYVDFGGRSISLRMADPRFWSRLAKVQAPTLVIHGSLDRLIPLAAAQQLGHRRPRDSRFWKQSVTSR
jgi:pimeloyl-ACP methyl ester carboxylesterase